MYNISICIPTYKRLIMLEQLICSILQSDLNKSKINTINIIIADNDSKKSAKETICSFQDKSLPPFKIYYHALPVKGLSFIRNELIKKTFLFDSDFLIFIDDDEYVKKEWLNQLVSAIHYTKADAVRGPVLAMLDKTVPKSISFWFKRESYSDYSQIYSLTTGNLILRCSSLRKHNIWFDPRFNNSGSEDGYFGVQLIKKGGKIFWTDKAIAYEHIPQKRSSLKWLIKRHYRVASTFTFILKIEKEYLKLAKKIMVSIGYIVSGVIGILLLSPFTNRYWGYLKISEGLGAFAGLVNIRYKEYK